VRSAAALALALLAGCAAPPAPESPAPMDFLPVAGIPSSRPVGRVLGLEPPSVRLDEPGRPAPPGLPLVARDRASLRPTALLRVVGGRGAVATVAVERGAPRPGDEVVEPSPAALEAARRLPAP
jgi:hypothetical protein